MPVSYSEAYKDLFGEEPPTDAPAEPGQQPDTTSADRVRTQGPVKRAVGAFASAVNPFPGMESLVKHPLEAAKSMSGVDLLNQGHDEFSQGHKAEGFRKMVLGSVPFLGTYLEHAYGELGEKIGEGDLAGAGGMIAGHGANVALMGGEGETVAKPVSAPLKAGSERMYQHVMTPNKWFRDLPRESQIGSLDKGLDNWIKPTEAGRQAADAAGTVLTDQIDDIANSSLRGQQRQPFDKVENAGKIEGTPEYDKSLSVSDRAHMKGINGRVRQVKFDAATLAEVQDGKQAIADQINAYNMLRAQPGVPPPPNLTLADITDAHLKASDYPSSITIKDLMDLKRQARASITTPTGRLAVSDAVDRLANNVANAANETMIDAFPALKGLGQESKEWINLRKITKEAAGRSANKSVFGLAGSMTPALIAQKGLANSLPVIGKVGMIAGVVRNPSVQATLASMIYKASKGVAAVGNVTGRLSGLAAMLDESEQKDQKDFSAINAK